MLEPLYEGYIAANKQTAIGMPIPIVKLCIEIYTGIFRILHTTKEIITPITILIKLQYIAIV